jgi:electron transport complex protein RnfB
MVALRMRHGKDDLLAERIDAVLPQTQCGKCDYAACLPYAEAVANGEADVNRCVPGGEHTMRSIARLMGTKPLPLEHEPADSRLAFIREDECIGCVLCIKVCPVDAIIGASKQYHTVIADHCTGCELCLEPCPVDCIDMLPKRKTLDQWTWPSPQYAAQTA